MSSATQRIAALEDSIKRLCDAVGDYRSTLKWYGEGTVETDEAYDRMAVSQLRALTVLWETKPPTKEPKNERS